MIFLKSWKHHLIFGNFLVIFWITVIYFGQIGFGIPEIFLLVVISLFSTLFPDIDLRISKIRNFVALTTAFGISLVYIYFFQKTWYYSLAYFLILYLLIKIIPTKHRGITHTVKFSFLFSIGILIILNLFLNLNQIENVFWFAIIFSSYNLHLLLDKI